MKGALRIIRQHNREAVAREVHGLPEGFEVVIREPGRTTSQNNLLWPILSEVSTACPMGRKHSPETWKCLFMHALGHETRFEQGLNGEPFPVGFRSSKLTKAQFSDLIEFIYSWCAQNGVELGREVQNA